MKKTTIIITAIIVVIILGIVVFYETSKAPGLTVVDFESCAAAGNPVMESYPRQCRTPDGRNFVEVIDSQPDKSDLIVVNSPKPGDIVGSPLLITGKARGTWFFEASFPIDLVVDEKIITTGIAQAKGDWMTTEFVQFEATLAFSSTMKCGTQKCLGPVEATLVLKKDNPSGLPEHDNSISIPIVLSADKATSTAVVACKPTGCSGQICSDEEVMTTCEYRAEYACYKTAKCERQGNGACGWTQTLQLRSCLKYPPPIN